MGLSRLQQIDEYTWSAPAEPDARRAPALLSGRAPWVFVRERWRYGRRT
jgi:hypothetical protein